MPDDDGQQERIIFSSERTLLLEDELSYGASPLSGVPIAIFSTELSGLQAIVRYLHESRQQTFAQIARLLNRSQKTVWATYAAARRMPFSVDESGLTIPLERFATRQFSPLETIVVYLASLGLTNVEIARRLNLDPRTTWTVKSRAARKGVRQ